MKRLKVYGGLTFRGTTQHRIIVATTSQKKVAEVVGITLYEVQNYWAETGNEEELKIALASPEKVFIKEGQPHHNGNYYELDLRGDKDGTNTRRL